MAGGTLDRICVAVLSHGLMGYLEFVFGLTLRCGEVVDVVEVAEAAVWLLKIGVVRVMIV